MKLWECTNGFTGSSYTRVYAIAEDAEAARELARQSFQSNAEEFGRHFPDHAYEPEYWTDIRVEELCSDTSQLWASRVKD